MPMKHIKIGWLASLFILGLDITIIVSPLEAGTVRKSSQSLASVRDFLLRHPHVSVKSYGVEDYGGGGADSHIFDDINDGVAIVVEGDQDAEENSISLIDGSLLGEIHTHKKRIPFNYSVDGAIATPIATDPSFAVPYLMKHIQLSLQHGKSHRLHLVKILHRSTWVDILHVDGDGNKQSDPFEVNSAGGYWYISYSCENMQIGDQTAPGNFAVFLKKPDNDNFSSLLVNTMGEKSDTTNIFTYGTFYLDIEGDEPFSVDVYVYK
jgi:hypothetical protein